MKPMTEAQMAGQECYDLLPAPMRVQIPGDHETAGQGEPVLWVKWFTPDSSWTWYVAEISPCAYQITVEDGEEVYGEVLDEQTAEALCRLWQTSGTRALPFRAREDDVRRAMQEHAHRANANIMGSRERTQESTLECHGRDSLSWIRLPETPESSGSGQARLREASQPGNGGGAGTLSDTGRGSASQERGSIGRQAGQPGSDDDSRAQAPTCPTTDGAWDVQGNTPALYELSDVICFGLVDGFEREWGDFSLAEIHALRGPFGLPVERDLYFEPGPASQVCPKR